MKLIYISFIYYIPICNTLPLGIINRVLGAAKRIPEETLEVLTCEVLGAVSFDPDMVRSKITAIRAEKSNMVVFCMDDGSEIVKRWTDRSRAESWTPEMKEKARQRALQARRKKE